MKRLFLLSAIVCIVTSLKSQIPNYTPNQVFALGPVALQSSPTNQHPAFSVTPPTGSNTTDGSVSITWNFGSGTRIRAWDMHGGLRFDGTLVSGIGNRQLNSGNSFQNTISGLAPGAYTFGVYRDLFDDNLTTNNQAGGNVDDYTFGNWNSVGGDQQRAGVYSVVLLPAGDNLDGLNASQQATANDCLTNDGSIRISGLKNGTLYEISTTVGSGFTITTTGSGSNFQIDNLYPGIYPVRIRVQGQTAFRLINVEVQVKSGVKCYTDNVTCSYSVGTNAITNGNFGTSASPTLPANSITDYTFVPFSTSDPQDSRYSLAWSSFFPDVSFTANNNWLLRNFDYTSRNNQLWGTMQATRDHTGSNNANDGTTNGSFMMVNANYQQDRVISISNLSIQACKEYELSFWVKNIQPYFARNKNNSSNPNLTYQPIIPRLGLVVNGIIYDFQNLNANQQPSDIITRTRLNDQGWQKVGVRFKAPVTVGNSTVTVYNFQQGGYGNDFAVDDIFFSEVTNPLSFSGNTSGSCGPSLTVLTTATAPCQQFGSPSYQWEVSANGGATYTNSGSPFSNLPNTVSATNTSPTIRYRLAITDGSCVTRTQSIFFMNSNGYCILPFEGLKLSGRIPNQVPELFWQVNDEQNVKAYELERSRDGNIFTAVTKLDAKGLNEYSFTDRNNNGEFYYRIKVILQNYEARYSNIIKLSSNTRPGASSLEVYPNPVREAATFNIASEKAGACELKIFDMSGKQVKAERIFCQKGVMAYTMNNFNALTPGMYTAELSTEEGIKLRTKLMLVK
ncbi:MAG: T9SS type A sorting domain-containing protein [Chitinophagaceae bacterium]|nr:T9SS type A sorting domain-containing protein [Chitinophagaceae bacterium]